MSELRERKKPAASTEEPEKAHAGKIRVSSSQSKALYSIS